MATNAVKKHEKKGVEVKEVVCWPSPECHDRCGLLVSAKDGRIVKIRRDRKNPANLRRSCPDRLPHLVKCLYHPDQLMHPSGC